MTTFALATCCIVALSGAEPEPRLTAIEAKPVVTNANLLANGGFEEPGTGSPAAGWQWDRRNTDATCTPDESVARSGKRSLRITNNTPFGPHVYGMLWRSEPVRLQPGKTYTLSAWVRSSKPGSIGLITGAGWQVRAYSAQTGSDWRPLSATFVPGPSDADCIVRVSTEHPATDAWIDDVKLEEGPEATPYREPGVQERFAVMPSAQAMELETSGSFTVPFMVTAPEPAEVQMTARLGSGSPIRARLRLADGANRVDVIGTAGAVSDQAREMSVIVEGLGKVGTATMSVKLLSAEGGRRLLADLERALPTLEAKLARVRKSGQDVSAPQVSMAVLRDFVRYVAEDLDRGEVRRALHQIRDLRDISARTRRMLESAIAGRTKLPIVPRYTGERRPAIENGSFVGPVRSVRGREERRPIFFNGFGHFGQAVADMEKWPAYGTNIIQVEFGPNSVFPTPDTVSNAPVQHMRSIMDRAQKAGVAVCLLISPHYMPSWALDKWPHLRKRRDGFLQYCLHAPEGQDLLKRFIATAIKPLADHPALHSICLSNEPINREEPCEHATVMWRDWLRTRHGDIATLNRRWGTSHASFDAVPLPDPFGPRPADPVWIDFIRWNEEFFAGWHRMLADAVHQVAPDLPVHAKAMAWTFLNTSEITFGYGADATLFGGLSQINGNDSICWYSFGQGEFAQGWQLNAMGHDLQRAVLDAPVFNSENHLIVDRETRYVPAEHVYTTLWQAAIHGQGATTIWVWERTFDPKSDFAGSIMHRPACAEAVGLANLDLNRAAHEVTAIQRAPARVALLHSVSGAVWNTGPVGEALTKAYTALAFSGIKTTFVTERQLEAGILPRTPVLIVPPSEHLSDRAFATLKRYPGKIVCMGEGPCLTRDEWGHPRNEELAAARVPFQSGPTRWQDLRRDLGRLLAAWRIRPDLDLREGQSTVADVAWRTGRMGNRLIANLCSFGHTVKKVTLMRNGKPVGATDISGRKLGPTLTLAPLKPMLVKVK